MKSERRHELQHNTLADGLVKSAELIKPYQNMIMGGVIVVLLIALGYTWWARESAAQATQAWDEMNAVIDSGNMPKLTGVIETYPGTSVAHMAEVVLADYYLGEGCSRLFVNKATGQEELGKAIKNYETVLQECRTPSLLERATFGLARAKESKGDLEGAEKLYAEVSAQWPQGAYAVAANQRLSDLKKPATKTMYDRFSNFDPKTAFSAMPGERPKFEMDSLPSDGTSSYIKFDSQEKKNKKEAPAPKASDKDGAKKAPEKSEKK